MNTTWFEIRVECALDLITNSSSELFVLKGESQNMVKEMIASVHPDYLTEYEEVRSLREIDDRELDRYINYHYETWSSRRTVIEGFTFDEMYGEVEFDDRKFIEMRDSFTEDNRKRIEDALDPEGKMFLLFSLIDNPDYDKQELLGEIGERYHLG